MSRTLFPTLFLSTQYAARSSSSLIFKSHDACSNASHSVPFISSLPSAPRHCAAQRRNPRSLRRNYASGAAPSIENWSTGPDSGDPDPSLSTYITPNGQDQPQKPLSGPMSGIPPPRMFATGPQKILATVLDSHGVVQQVAGELPKTELLSSLGIQPRDLRKVAPDQHLSPDILVRDRAIIISLLHCKALLTCEKVYIVPPLELDLVEAGNMNLLLFELETATRRPPNREPFEFRVLEAILISVVRSLQVELEDKHVKRINKILERLEVKVDASSLKELLILSKEFGSFGQKANSVYLAVNEVLNNDEDLAGLFLTAKHLQKPRAISDHWEAELLLETYVKQLEEIVRRYEEVRDHIKHTEDVVGIVLDSVRNELLVFELRLVTFTTGISCGSMLASYFGMNLLNTYETSNLAFLGVSLFGLVLVALVSLRLRAQLSKIARSGLGKDWARHNVNSVIHHHSHTHRLHDK
ncbi:cora-domain-containing protein, partial [Gonapodya prolifera JEL478]